jgi:transposase
MEHQTGVPKNFCLPDATWERVKPLLPPEPPKPKGGHPRNYDRQTMDAIFFVLRTGIQWKALPRGIAAGSSAHDRFQEWQTGRGISQDVGGQAVNVRRTETH